MLTGIADTLISESLDRSIFSPTVLLLASFGIVKQKEEREKEREKKEKEGTGVLKISRPCFSRSQ